MRENLSVEERKLRVDYREHKKIKVVHPICGNCLFGARSGNGRFSFNCSLHRFNVARDKTCDTYHVREGDHE